MNTRRKSNKWCVYNTSYHIIRCPKYRRKVLRWAISDRLKQLLAEKADSLWIEIPILEVMEDHVHLFVKSKPIYAPHYLVQQFKWFTSRILRQEFEELRRRLPTLWTRSYYIETVWHISEATIKKYIQEQKNK